MLIKLDMENAFDRVRLSFLYKVLRSFGFSSTIVNLIKASTDKPWISPLINGRSKNFFQATRGLHQPCLLSSFLYILMAKYLSRNLSTEKEARIILGIKFARGVDSINHALFADDYLLLGGASLKIERDFKGILQNFCIVSGALINNRKSVVYGWNADHSTILNIANLLEFYGYDIWKKIKYLSLSLTLRQNKPSLWVEVISKIQAKNASWGGQWLMKAGKLIMIKLILSALPIYQSSLLLTPK